MSSYTGIIKWFNVEKGYGFISANNGNDIFVHHSQLKENGPDNTLHEGESVSFSIADGQKGPVAINVHKL